MSDSNVYVVSPPTLYMPTGGVAICLISNDKSWQDKIVEIIESGIQDQITFYANDSGVKDPKAWVWYWHIVDNCNMVLCDVASCTEHEVRVALAIAKLEHPIIFYVKPGNDEFIALLKASEILHFSDVDDLPTLLEALFG